VFVQGFVMAADAWWNVCGIENGDVKVFVDFRNVDAGRTGEAVVAVYAVALEAALVLVNDGAVILIRFVCVKVLQRFQHFPPV
jgi:hypothetical protein